MKHISTRFIFGLVVTLFCGISGLASSAEVDNFLVISDVHLDRASNHAMVISPAGANLDNDLDPVTFEKLLHGLDENIRTGVITKPNFIILLGDIVGHLRTNRDGVVDSEASVFGALKKNFPGTPLFYVFGNNDSLTANYGPFTDADSASQFKSPDDVAKIKGGWSQGFLSTGLGCMKDGDRFPCLITADTAHGYYASYVKPGLRLIGLNSVLYSRKNGMTSEAASELTWLTQQLETAKVEHESVLIAMHIPFGNNVYDHSQFWSDSVQGVFLKTIKSYSSIIIGMLASHTHEEELKIIKDDAGRNIAGLFFVAGLSTSHGNEPSAKTFYLDKKDGNWLLSNYEAFHFSDDGSGALTFGKLYDYRSYYCGSHVVVGLYSCLDDVTVDKMKKQFSAGNKNFGGTINSPGDIVVIAP